MSKLKDKKITYKNGLEYKGRIYTLIQANPYTMIIDEETGEMYSAICHDDDKYNYELGEQIALLRMEEDLLRQELEIKMMEVDSIERDLAKTIENLDNMCN